MNDSILEFTSQTYIYGPLIHLICTQFVARSSFSTAPPCTPSCSNLICLLHNPLCLCDSIGGRIQLTLHLKTCSSLKGLSSMTHLRIENMLTTTSLLSLAQHAYGFSICYIVLCSYPTVLVVDLLAPAVTTSHICTLFLMLRNLAA